MSLLLERRFNALHVLGFTVISVTASIGIVYYSKEKAPPQLYINRDEAVAREIGFLPKRHHISTFFSCEKHPYGSQNLQNKQLALATSTEEAWAESDVAMRAAIDMQLAGKTDKAAKLFRHALQLNPYRADLLAEYGVFLAETNDPVRADTFIMKALIISPQNEKALQWRRRTQPVVETIDQQIFDRIERKKRALVSLVSPPHASSQSGEQQQHPHSDDHPGLRRTINELYFEHIYHTCAIEGNTMTLDETRYIIETHMSVYGKSIQEHGEIIGLDAALSYINSTLVRSRRPIQIGDLLDIHLRVIGYADPINAGRLRTEQVYISNRVPPPAQNLTELMNEYLAWLNSEEAFAMHPIKLAAVAHYWLAWIHPFLDGNGRTSRLLMNLLLMRAGYPPIIIKLQDRQMYFDLFKEAEDGDVRWFYRFIAQIVERTLDQYLTVVVEDLTVLKRLGVNITAAAAAAATAGGDSNDTSRVISDTSDNSADNDDDDATVPDGIVLIPPTTFSSSDDGYDSPSTPQKQLIIPPPDTNDAEKCTVSKSNDEENACFSQSSSPSDNSRPSTASYQFEEEYLPT